MKLTKEQCEAYANSELKSFSENSTEFASGCVEKEGHVYFNYKRTSHDCNTNGAVCICKKEILPTGVETVTEEPTKEQTTEATTEPTRKPTTEPRREQTREPTGGTRGEKAGYMKREDGYCVKLLNEDECKDLASKLDMKYISRIERERLPRGCVENY